MIRASIVLQLSVNKNVEKKIDFVIEIPNFMDYPGSHSLIIYRHLSSIWTATLQISTTSDFCDVNIWYQYGTLPFPGNVQIIIFFLRTD